MRIEKVRICNIHSLAGKHTLDFEAPPFEGAGLFVIAGPTGAGKSTILDAITLALYGRIARHDGHFTEVVSHGADSAFAEVVFETDGRKVLARWEITRKTRGANKGQLNAATRTVSVYDEHTKKWQVKADKIREADKLIEQLLGLTYDQFTRTVFLPQGAFTNFLKASGRERAEILEGLTGTEIYGELSKYCFQLAKEKRADVEAAQNRLAELKLLTEEEIANIQAQMAELENEVTKHAQAIAALEGHLAKAREYDKAQQELQRLQRELAEAKAERAEAAERLTPLKENLALTRKELQAHRAKKAALEKRWQAMQQMDKEIALQQQKVDNARKQLEESRRALSRIQEEIARLDAEIGELEQKKARHQQWLDERPYLESLQSEMSAIKTAWEDIGELDEKLEGLRSRAAQLAKELAQKKDEATQLEGKKQALERKGEELCVAISKMGIQPQELSEELDRLHEQQPILQKAIHTLETGIAKLEELQQATERARNLEAQIADHTKTLESIQEELKQLEAKLPTLESDIVEAERQRDLEMLARDLAAHRDKLQEGEPCPLCGATHHPALKHDIVPKVDKAEQRLSALKTERDELTSKISSQKTREDSLKQQIDENRAQLDEVRKKISSLEAEIASLKKALPTPRPESEWIPWLDELKAEQAQKQIRAKRLQKLAKEWQDWEKSMGEVGDALKETQHQLKSLKDKLSQTQNEIEEKNGEKTRLEARITRTIEEAGVAEPLSPALWNRLKSELRISKELQKELQDISIKLAGKKGEREEKHQQLTQLDNDIFDGEKILEKENILLEKLNRERKEKFGDSQVDDERKQWDDQEKALRQKEEEHQNQLEEVEKRIGELKGRIEEKEKQCKEQQKQLKETEQQLAPLLVEHGDLAQAVKYWEWEKAEAARIKDELLKARGRLEQQLADHYDNEKRADQLREELQALIREAERWQALSDLIGSAEGQKFRTLAQALTLNQLIAHANRQLAKLLQGRYRLHTTVDAKSNTVSLELFIVDQFQADTERPVSSLSGGESFLVSLALALGLSEMAGGKIRVDSLFIDEGFGTLDDKNLDTAMEVLESLRSSGRLVGIISHVKELKERIPVQVLVRPQGGGFSTIEVVEALPGTP